MSCTDQHPTVADADGASRGHCGGLEAILRRYTANHPQENEKLLYVPLNVFGRSVGRVVSIQNTVPDLCRRVGVIGYRRKSAERVIIYRSDAIFQICYSRSRIRKSTVVGFSIGLIR